MATLRVFNQNMPSGCVYNPPHPGEFIKEVYIEPYELSGRFLAAKLGVSPSTLNRLLNGQSHVSPEVALRLSKALGRTPESWLALQNNHDLWQARQRADLQDVGKVELAASASASPA